MNTKYEVKRNEKLGRYLVAAKDLKPGERILSDQPFVLGPNSETSLVCFNCYLPLISKFLVCKNCAVAPICPGDGCSNQFAKWHNQQECDFFRNLKLNQGMSPMTMVQNVGSLLVLRAILKRETHPQEWKVFMELETHLDRRRESNVWEYYDNTVKFIQSLGLFDNGHNKDLVQHICAAIDVNSFEVRGPPIPGIGCAETLRAVYPRAALLAHDCVANTHMSIDDSNVLVCHASRDIQKGEPIYYNYTDPLKVAIDVNSFEVRGPPIPGIGYAETLRAVYPRAALLAHDCVANTHMSIDDSNVLVCHASRDIKKGEPIYYNYTDPLKGTVLRQQHLMVGKYFKCTCNRCSDITELGMYMSSALCPHCKKGYISKMDDVWVCHSCAKESEKSAIDYKVQCCSNKLEVINKKDEKELEEYIRNVSLVLAPNHYLLLDAKQRLAGVLRDTINREPRPTKKMMRRKIELCQEILPILETLSPGICRTKAITLYELHETTVQLAKKMSDAREITAPAYVDELLNAERYLKRSLEMLVLEPGNSPEGELCAKALEEYRALKITIAKTLDGIYADGKSCQSNVVVEEIPVHPEVD